MKDEIRDRLINEVQVQLRTYPVYTAKMRAKDTLKRCLGKKPEKTDRFFWPHGMLTYALMEAHQATGDGAYLTALQEYAERYRNAGLPVRYVDNVMNGACFLYLYRVTGEKKFMQAAEKLADYVLDSAKETRSRMERQGISYDGSLIYRKGNPTHVYVDALGMMCPVLTQLGTLVPDAGSGQAPERRKEYLETGLLQLKNFLEKGMDQSTGLPYHGYDLKTGEKMGIIGWGRAVGWLLMALSDSLAYIQDSMAHGMQSDPQTKETAEELKRQFAALLETVFRYQREDGLFSWQLQALDGPADTSATAMILYAVKQGIRSGVLTGGYDAAVEKGIQGLCSRVKNGTVAQCLAECMGYAQYPQVYGAYPWGLAMTTAVLFMSI